MIKVLTIKDRSFEDASISFEITEPDKEVTVTFVTPRLTTVIKVTPDEVRDLAKALSRELRHTPAKQVAISSPTLHS